MDKIDCQEGLRQSSLMAPSFQLKAPLRASLILVSGAVLQRLSNLGLIALLTFVLTAEDYGRYSLFASLLSLVPLLASWSLQTAAQRLTFDYDSPLDRASFLKSNLVFSLLLSAFNLGLLFLVFSSIRSLDPWKEGLTSLFLPLVLLCGFLTVIIEFSRVHMRIEGRLFSYNTLTLLQHFGLLVLCFAMSRLLEIQAQHVYVAYALSLLLSSLYGLWHSLPKLRQGHLQGFVLRDSLRFSGPLALHGLAGWLIAHSGRWVGAQSLSLESMAPYFLIVQGVSVLQMLSGTLLDARVPDLGKHITAGDYKGAKQVIHQALLLSGSLCLLAFILGAFLLYVFPFPLPEHFRISPTLYLLALAITLIETLYVRGIQLLTLVKKTEIQFFITLFSGSLTLALSWIFVRRNPSVEALLTAYLLGSSCQCLLTNLISTRYTRLEKGSVNEPR